MLFLYSKFFGRDGRRDHFVVIVKVIAKNDFYHEESQDFGFHFSTWLVTQASFGAQQHPSPIPVRAVLSQNVLTPPGKASAVLREPGAAALKWLWIAVQNSVPKHIAVCCVKYQKYQGLMTTGVISEGLTQCIDGTL